MENDCAHNLAVFDGGGGLECTECGERFVLASKLDSLQKDYEQVVDAFNDQIERAVNAEADKAQAQSRLDSLRKQCEQNLKSCHESGETLSYYNGYESAMESVLAFLDGAVERQSPKPSDAPPLDLTSATHGQYSE